MSRARIVPSLFAVLALLSGCDKTDKGSSTTTSAVQTGATSTTTATTPKPEDTIAKPQPTATTKKEPAVTFKGVDLAVPESVLYDQAADLYLVSNVNGKPTDVDNNGFISRLTPDGKVEKLKWIEGGKNKVTLNAPKGMTTVGDVLYVADLDTVPMFDLKTGAPSGEVKIPGATFLNDIAAHPDGRVLVSDSGLKGSASGLDPSGTDAIYAIDKAKKVTTIVKDKDLGRPNGMLPMADKIWVVTFGTGDLYALDAKGKKTDVQKLPAGQLDGIVALPGGDVLISSWESGSLYRGKPGGTFNVAIEGVKAPADIGLDTKRNRVLVPLFQEDEVRAYDLR